MLRRAFSLPEALIHRRLNAKGIRLEIFTIFLFGILGSAGLWYYVYDVWNSMEDYAMPTYLPYSLVGIAIGPLVLIVLAWLWYSVSAHFIAKFSTGRGPIIRLLRTSAWSLIPVGIWLLLRSAVVFALFYLEDLPGVPEENVITPDEIAKYYLDLGLEDPVYVAVLVSGVLFVAWSWYLLSTAIAEAKEISRDSAKRIAIVPTGVLAIYLLSLAWQWQSSI